VLIPGSPNLTERYKPVRYRVNIASKIDVLPWRNGMETLTRYMLLQQIKWNI